MRLFNFVFSLILMASTMAVPVFITGCATHAEAGYRVYDPYYGDYHTWDNGEAVYYSRWENETHRNHEDFRKRNSDEQKQYWTWRHNQH
jgi:hypothetical protein